MSSFDSLPNDVTEIRERLTNIERLLLERGSEPQTSTADRLLTVAETAAFLNLSVPTIYALSHKAAIPTCKRGKRLYFSTQELTEWVKAGRKKTLAETASDAATYTKERRANRA